MDEFIDKVVVVTGGSSGIGKAIATKFDAEGAKIALFGRDKNRLEATLKNLKKAIGIQGDARKISDLSHLYEETKNHLGKIDVLIVNAGVSGKRSLHEVDEKFFDEIVDTNFKGAYFTVQQAVSKLNDGASVLLISSAACHGGWQSHSVYSATKAAVSMLARSLSADLIHRGIRVNAISPGYTDTPIFDSRKKIDPEYVSRKSKTIPLGRFANPEEIAEAAFFLSSSKGSYIAGIDLVIDGGITAIYPNQNES